MCADEGAHMDNANAFVRLLEDRVKEALNRLKEAENALDELKERVKAQQEKVEEAKRYASMYVAVLEEESRRLGVSPTLPTDSEREDENHSRGPIPAVLPKPKRMPRGTSQRLLELALDLLADNQEHALSEIIGHVERTFGQRIAPSTLRAALDRSPRVKHSRTGYYQLSKETKAAPVG